jgi:SAM-dependent methyltransferase
MTPRAKLSLDAFQVSDAPAQLSCKVCGAGAGYIGSKKSLLREAFYHFYSCPSCGFFFVGNPWLEYSQIYNEAYYRGQGGDPTVDYYFEMDHAGQSIRQYEYQGLLKIARRLMKRENFAWLDYGCGSGGLLDYVGSHSGIEICGFEEGEIAAEARRRGRKILDLEGLEPMEGKFDLITAIEVLEHEAFPLALLERVKKLLKPGGVFFATTGNAAPQRRQFLKWHYASAPDVHVSFFQPQTLALAMSKAGLQPEGTGYLPGHTEVIKYKILKKLGLGKKSPFFALVPWFLACRLLNLRLEITGLPLGRRAGP